MRDFNLRVYEPLPTVSGWPTSPGTVKPAYLKDITDRAVEGFPRTVSLEGDLEGLITIRADGDGVNELRQWFDSWMGCHVEETSAGLTWAGFIYKMDFIYRGDRDRRALFGVPDDEAVWNAVKAIYTAPSVTESDQLVTNGGFEVAGTGSPDIFNAWAETAGSGTITRNPTIKHSGGFSCALTTAGGGGNTFVSQYYPANEGEKYQLLFWARGNGSVAGRYRITNETTGADIVALTSTGVTGTTWTQVTKDFTVPAGCKSIGVHFYNSSTASTTVYFDDAELRQYKPTSLETGWFTNDQSIARYGRREKKLEVGVTNLTNAEKEAQRFLEKRAWPWARPVSSDGRQRNNPTATLEIYVIGYLATAMYRYSTSTVGKSLELLITDIINNDCDFLTPAKIGTEFTASALTQDEVPEGRALEVIRALINKGTANDLPTYFNVTSDRRAQYIKLDVTPKYFRRKGVISTNVGGTVALNPRQARPGVVRRMDYPVAGREKGSVLLDRRDMLVTVFEVDEAGELGIGDLSALAESRVYRWLDRFRPRPTTPQPIGHDGGQEFGAFGDKGDPADDVDDGPGGHGGHGGNGHGPGLHDPFLRDFVRGLQEAGFTVRMTDVGLIDHL
ncbi:MAG: hypothetical protein L0332_06810 [Chloroflexi bacterium]|nr:hypothetical protein [Chloroflexota bacterium]